MANLTLINGRVLRDDDLVEEPLHIADGCICSEAPPGATEIDAAGGLVLPGIVDIHGDGFEAHIMPRPGVTFALDLALLSADAQIISQGITTAFHGLTVSWEPGLRSLETARHFMSTLIQLRPHLRADTRLHFRWETFASEAMADIKNWLQQERQPILAFNDHTSPLLKKGLPDSKFAKMASRAGISTAAFREELNHRWANRESVLGNIQEMAKAGRQYGAALLAHDEYSPDMRSHFRRLGAVVSEFPMNDATLCAAQSAAEDVVLGAPNVVRGGSHLGGVDATKAVLDGSCTILASDYYYPAQLQAAFHLYRRYNHPLSQSWALVSTNPAKAAGLTDRGALVAGKRGDVIIVDDQIIDRPCVRATIVKGQIVSHWSLRGYNN